MIAPFPRVEAGFYSEHVGNEKQSLEPFNHY